MYAAPTMPLGGHTVGVAYMPPAFPRLGRRADTEVRPYGEICKATRPVWVPLGPVHCGARRPRRAGPFPAAPQARWGAGGMYAAPTMPLWGHTVGVAYMPPAFPRLGRRADTEVRPYGEYAKPAAPDGSTWPRALWGPPFTAGRPSSCGPAGSLGGGGFPVPRQRSTQSETRCEI